MAEFNETSSDSSENESDYDSNYDSDDLNYLWASDSEIPASDLDTENEYEEDEYEEDPNPSFNRYDVDAHVSDPYQFKVGTHYGPDKMSEWQQKLINRFNSYREPSFKLTAKQLNDIWNYKSSNTDILNTRPKNWALIPNNPHIGPGNPIYYKSYNELDEIARQHDISYSHAESPLDIYKADMKMLKQLDSYQADSIWPWFVKQIASNGIKYKHSFELQYGVVYPKFTPEQIQFMKENYPEYTEIMNKVEENNKNIINTVNDLHFDSHNRFLTYLATNKNIRQAATRIGKVARDWVNKSKTFYGKLSSVISGGAVWKDPYLRDIIQWSERYHEQLENNYVNDPKHAKDMIKIHLGFYQEREQYWKDQFKRIIETPHFHDLSDYFKKLEKDINNLDEIEYKALYNYMNKDDRGWGHAFSYDIYWDLTEYHNNQFKHWVKQTYDKMRKQRDDMLKKPLLRDFLPANENTPLTNGNNDLSEEKGEAINTRTTRSVDTVESTSAQSSKSFLLLL